MIDSLLTLTDDHLREHKHLTLSASCSLNTSGEAPPFHLQTTGFSPIFITPDLRQLPFSHASRDNVHGWDLTSLLMVEKQTNRELGLGTSGLILANFCIRHLRGEVIFCTDAQSNLLEGTWPGSQIQFHLERKSLWIKKSISRMTPGMNHFIRNGKYRGITTRWRPLWQHWGWQKRIY